MKKLFLIIAIFFIAISVQAQMYTFSHKRMTSLKNNIVQQSVEAISHDTLFIDGANVQLVLDGEFVEEKIISTKIIPGFIRYTVPKITIDIPEVANPDRIIFTMEPDKNKIAYQIVFYIENIYR